MSGPPPGLRQVRSVVTINGAAMAGLIHWSAEETEFTTPDTFEATFALHALPPAMNAAYWAETSSAEVEIFVGEPRDPNSYTSADLTSIFVGKVDDPDVDWAGTTLKIMGRDLTAPLIDTKTSEKYINKTSSEIAETLAAKYGLKPVITATTTKAGKLYAQDHVELKDERTEWDLITWLARKEGFVVFVKGRELHFQPKPAAGASKPFHVTRVAAGQAQTEAGNYVALTTGRSLTIAGDIKVTVKSWGYGRTKKAYERFAVRKGKSSGTGRGSGAHQKQEYSYSIPNLSPDQAQQRANTLLEEVSKHIMRMSFGGAAAEDLHVDGIVALEGTATAWDQTYFPETIHREFDPEDGYSWTVSAKNHPTEDEPTI